jgi:hypothetical protein
MGFHSVIACLLIVCQAFIGAGFGPRALCRDPDGSTCVDSILTPCCCHRQPDAPCCGDDECDETTTSAVCEPGVNSCCQCVCTPVTAQPLIAQAGTKAHIGFSADTHAAVVHVALPPMPCLSAVHNWCGPFRTGPPGRSHLAQLDSVILRL